MNIIVQYYNDPNSERQKEYDECMRINLNHTFVKSIHNIFEPGAKIPEEFLKHPKHVKVNISGNLGQIPGRLTFACAFEYANKNFEKDEIVAILNLDIFLSSKCSEWNTIKEDFFDYNTNNASIYRVLCLNRYETNSSRDIIKDLWSFKGECQDAWIFKTPLKSINDCNFAVGGCPGCDNAIAHRFTQAGYHVYNWSLKYHIVHLDICRGHVQARHMIYTEKTDNSRPNERGGLILCPYLPYEHFLATNDLSKFEHCNVEGEHSHDNLLEMEVKGYFYYKPKNIMVSTYKLEEYNVIEMFIDGKKYYYRQHGFDNKYKLNNIK